MGARKAKSVQKQEGKRDDEMNREGVVLLPPRGAAAKITGRCQDRGRWIDVVSLGGRARVENYSWFHSIFSGRPQARLFSLSYQRSI